MIRKLLAALALAGLSFATLAETAMAADLYQPYGYTTYRSGDIAARHQGFDRGSVPECDSASVIGDVARRAAWPYPAADVGIASFDRIQETRFKPGDPGIIDRRYCQARVSLDPRHHTYVYYLIEERMGFASIGWNVEFCVPGRDPFRVYDGWCRAIR